jgi:hypothetical protein
MTDKLTEYIQRPVLSPTAQNFIDQYEGHGDVPADIKIELEKYLKDNEPFVQQAHQRLRDQFAKIFNK